MGLTVVRPAAGAAFAGLLNWITSPGSLWTIPLVAGLLNWATNRLAIAMMFYPLKFVGIQNRNFRIGWQGIVPSKAKVMANKVVDDVVNRLIDLKVVFARLSPERMPSFSSPHPQGRSGGPAEDL